VKFEETKLALHACEDIQTPPQRLITCKEEKNPRKELGGGEKGVEQRLVLLAALDVEPKKEKLIPTKEKWA